MLPSPAELTYFSEVAHCLNLSRASEKLGLSQPSLSLAIKRLECTLGTHLFIRHKQGVTLTSAGEQLLAQVKPLLEHWENTKIQTRASHSEVQGRVTIGCRSTMALYLSKFVLYLLEKHPRLEINFSHQSSQKTTEGVINSSIDIGIVVNPLRHDDLIIHELDNTEITFWVGAGERNIQDIHSGQAVIICEPNIPQVNSLLRKIEKENISIDRIITANSLEVIAHLTMEGCGIGILPSCFAQMLYANKLKRVADLPVCSNEICLIYRYENKNVRAVNTVVTALKGFSAE